jgi:hypothetical protein
LPTCSILASIASANRIGFSNLESVEEDEEGGGKDRNDDDDNDDEEEEEEECVEIVLVGRL